jgi:uncharacterized protein YxjI
MEVKIECGCGTRFKFDVEPVYGRMPMPVQCPNCGCDATTDANQMLARLMPESRTSLATPPRPAPAPATAPAVPAPAPAQEPVRVAIPTWRVGMEQSTPAAPASLLERTTFFIKERVGLLKLTDTYDILDPATGRQIGIAKEEPPAWAKWLRLVVKKHMLPTALNIYEAESQPALVTVRRGFTFLRSKLHVTSSDGRKLGYFRSKLISLGGGFLVFDNQEQQAAEVKGDWKGWNFRFLNKSGREIGTVTKKWAGLGKELFTSADNYVISLTDVSNRDTDAVALLLAAGLCIDVVFKEKE